MNIHIVQHDIVTNNPEANLEWILEELDRPESKSALLTVFPACTLCGYPVYGSVAYTDIQKRAQAALQELIARSEHRAFLVGMPLQLQDRGLCNAIVFVQNNAVRATVTKKYLAPDEQKYFVRGEGVQLIQFQEQRLAIGFYEDLKELGKLAIEQPDIVVCCGCNVFDYNRPYRTRYRMRKIVENLNASLVYANRIGGEGSFLQLGALAAAVGMGIDTAYGVSGMVKERQNAYAVRHTIEIVIGVLFCILSVIPVLVSETEISAALLLVMISAGVFLLVKTGRISGGFKKLLEEDRLKCPLCQDTK